VVGPDAVALAAVLMLVVAAGLAGSIEPHAGEVAADTTASVEMGEWVAGGEGGEDVEGRGEREAVGLGCCRVRAASGDVVVVVVAAVVAVGGDAAAGATAAASMASLLVSRT